MLAPIVEFAMSRSSILLVTFLQLIENLLVALFRFGGPIGDTFSGVPDVFSDLA